MSNTSGIISEKDVLQIGDSKAVLSADKNNTSYLCTYSTINPWSTYKPINYPAITREDYPLSAFAHTGFKRNRSKDGKSLQAGLIAQDVLKVLPSIVHKQGDYLALDYIQLIPYMLSAIQYMYEELKNSKII